MYTHIFSHTEDGVKALDTLYDNYKRYSRFNATEVAARMGFKGKRLVEFDDPRPTAGKYKYVESIGTTRGMSPLLRDFVIAHELGHHWLMVSCERVFLHQKLEMGEHLELESILDNFARAMIFGAAGVKLMNESNYRQYLRDNELSREFASEERFIAEKEMYQGHAIVAAAKKAKFLGPVTKHNLINLGEFLLANGKALMQKLKEPPG